MSEKIYVVFGATGEYSDYTEWMVDAWRYEQDAQERIMFLNSKMLEIGINGNTCEFVGRGVEKINKMREHDKSFRVCDVKPEYSIIELELKP